ncbi:unnamed protein product [Calypogeia fissa]
MDGSGCTIPSNGQQEGWSVLWAHVIRERCTLERERDIGGYFFATTRVPQGLVLGAPSSLRSNGTFEATFSPRQKSEIEAPMEHKVGHHARLNLKNEISSNGGN